MLISSTNIRLRTIVCSSDVMEVKKYVLNIYCTYHVLPSTIYFIFVIGNGSVTSSLLMDATQMKRL